MSQPRHRPLGESMPRLFKGPGFPRAMTIAALGKNGGFALGPGVLGAADGDEVANGDIGNPGRT